MKRTRKFFRDLATGISLICVCMALITPAFAKKDPEPQPQPQPQIQVTIVDKPSISLDFEWLIAPFKISLESEMIEVELEGDNHVVYTGELVKPDVKVTFGEKKLILDKDYTVKYRNNQEVGDAEVVIQGKGIFTGEIKRSFTIDLSGQAIADYALQFVGTPYVYGGTSPSGFDCSGFVQFVYNQFGISLPRTSYDQRNVGTYVSSMDELKPGDILVFYSGGHVGIYIGQGKFVHAANSSVGVVVSSFCEDEATYDHYANSFLSAARIL